MKEEEKNESNYLFSSIHNVMALLFLFLFFFFHISVHLFYNRKKLIKKQQKIQIQMKISKKKKNNILSARDRVIDIMYYSGVITHQ